MSNTFKAKQKNLCFNRLAVLKYMEPFLEGLPSPKHTHTHTHTLKDAQTQIQTNTQMQPNTQGSNEALKNTKAENTHTHETHTQSCASHTHTQQSKTDGTQPRAKKRKKTHTHTHTHTDNKQVKAETENTEAQTHAEKNTSETSIGENIHIHDSAPFSMSQNTNTDMKHSQGSLHTQNTHTHTHTETHGELIKEDSLSFVQQALTAKAEEARAKAAVMENVSHTENQTLTERGAVGSSGIVPALGGAHRGNSNSRGSEVESVVADVMEDILPRKDTCNYVYEELLTVMCAALKVYASQLVCEARVVSTERGGNKNNLNLNLNEQTKIHDKVLLPLHVYEASRRLKTRTPPFHTPD